MVTGNQDRPELQGPDLDKTHSIIVNGRPRTVDSDELSFNQVIELAFDPVPTGPGIIFHVLYSNSPGRPPDGRLVAGGSVKVQDSTVFNVSFTDKS